MTARKLYDTSPEFREAIAIWVRDGRCPYDLGDWLEDRGMLTQADAARWAASVERRPCPENRFQPDYTSHHPRPRASVARDGAFCWTASSRGSQTEFSHTFPSDAVPSKLVIYGDTEELAIVALLDAWSRKPGGAA